MGSSHVDWVPPESFDEYRLVKLLGRGSMGQVWLVHDTVLDRLVAVKFIAELPVNDAVRHRFLTEARAAARVQHHNIIAVYRVGEIGPRPYLISEYVRGDSLDKLARPVAWPRLLEIAIGLARGLGAAHRQGVLHRDLKPANAIVSETGEVKLLDFGLAKLLPHAPPPHTDALPHAAPPHTDALPAREVAATLPGVPGDPTITTQGSSVALGSSPGSGFTLPQATPSQVARSNDPPGCYPAIDLLPSVTRAGAVMGTPAYMPPEAWRGEPATPRSDVYSLGALLYSLGAGAPPHRGDSPEAVRRSALDTDAPPLAIAAPGMDPSFAAVVDRCLQRDPAERFASGDAVLEALEALTAGDKAAASAPAPAPRARPRTSLRTSLRIRGLLFAGAMLTLTLGFFAYRQCGHAHSPPPGRCPEEMVQVPPGTFQMGSPEGEGDPDEHPQHEVTLSAYCIDKTEVTVVAYAACVAAGGCVAAPLTVNTTSDSIEGQRHISRWCNGMDHPDHPINCVDWEQAAAYCAWDGKRLPTEAEWEYAARGSDHHVYPWGIAAPDASRLNACGSECEAMGRRELIGFEPMHDHNDGWETTAPVGSFPEGASPFGALDMAGNVGEWTADWYGGYAMQAETNPQGPQTGTSRVSRGGGWDTRDASKVRAANRDWPDPMIRAFDLGFRCARGR